MNIQRLREVLRERMAQAGLRQKALALKSGLNATAVRDILKGRSKNPKIATLSRLCATLGIELQDFLAEIDAVPVRGTAPSPSVAARARGGTAHASSLSSGKTKLERLLAEHGHDLRWLSERTKISQSRLKALAQGAPDARDELTRINQAWPGVGVFDWLDFPPIKPDEQMLIVELRRMTDADRRQVRTFIERFSPANDLAPKSQRRRA